MPRTLTRHDYVLAALPTSLLVGALVGAVTTLAMWVSLGVGSVVAAGPLAWALFVEPP